MIKKLALPLLENVHNALEVHGKLLQKILGKPPFLNQLDRLILADKHTVNQARINLLKPYNAKTPINLLKALYPKPHNTFQNRPKQGFNYNTVFEEYKKVNLTSIEPSHLNYLIDNFLRYPKFKRPVKILNSRDKPSQTIVHGYMALWKIRHHYIQQINRLFGDLKAHNLPISTDEQNQFLKYIFFKDRYDIDERVDRALELKQLKRYQQTSFTFDFYKKLRLEDTSSLNNLLQLSLMHNNREIFDDILTRITYDRNTYKLLLDAYSGQFKDESKFFLLVQEIDIPMDITVVNCIMRGYVELGKAEEAMGFIKDMVPLKVDTPNKSVYQYLTTKDKQMYSKYLSYYDFLSKYASLPSIQLSPNIETFTPLLRYYSDVRDFGMLQEMVGIIDKFDLPLTTKSFEIIFEKLDPQQTIVMLPRLLHEFKDNYSLDFDFKTTVPAETSYGQLVKLPDLLVGKIVGNAEKLNPQVRKLHETFENDVKFIRRNTSHKDLYTINQVTHLKYEFLQYIHSLSELE